MGIYYNLGNKGLVSTDGGVSLEEIETCIMQLRLVQHAFLLTPRLVCLFVCLFVLGATFLYYQLRGLILFPSQNCDFFFCIRIVAILLVTIFNSGVAINPTSQWNTGQHLPKLARKRTSFSFFKRYGRRSFPRWCCDRIWSRELFQSFYSHKRRGWSLKIRLL